MSGMLYIVQVVTTVSTLRSSSGRVRVSSLSAWPTVPLAIRNDLCATIGRVQYAAPGYIAEQLFASTLVPVCTPELAAGLRKP